MVCLSFHCSFWYVLYGLVQVLNLGICQGIRLDLRVQFGLI